MNLREQTEHLRQGGPNAMRLVILALLMLSAVCWQPTRSLAAQAETAEAETATEPAEQAESEERAAAKTDDKSEAEEKSEESSEGKEAKEPPKEEPSEEKSDEVAKEEAKQKSDDDKSEESKPEAKSQEAKPPEETETSVETERTMEEEPHKPAAKDEPKKEKEPAKQPGKEKCIIGSTATLLEKQSGLKFRARIDTGAKSCSLHVEKITIQDGSTKEDIAEQMTENIGKVITFVVKNGDGKTHILKRKIAGYVIIKTSNKSEGKRRYKVPLTFLWKNTEKEVLVTLNNRQHMNYPLLIGRNFLRDDFLVDVSIDSSD